MILELLQAVTGIFVVVYDGQHALKFNLGRARGVVGPGVHFKLPIVQKFTLEETKHTTLDLEPQVIQLTDDLIYEVDTKLMYRIYNLRKALIEIDDLVTGLQNRVVLAVQRVVRKRDRDSVKDTDAMAAEVMAELKPVEEEWGVRILQLGFSNISPSPATLEITQLDLLARERLQLFQQLQTAGLSAEAAVALVTGAVVATQPGGIHRTPKEISRDEALLIEEIDDLAKLSASAEKAKQDDINEPGVDPETPAQDEEDPS